MSDVLREQLQEHFGLDDFRPAQRGVIESVIYLTMSEARFEETYIRGPRAWF